MDFKALSRGLFFGLMLLFSSLFGVLVYGGCFLPLFVISPKTFRSHFDRMMGTWEYLCVALLELVMGVQIRITGDEIRPSESNLILMNHRTRLDWLYFWSVLVRQSGVKSEKIILKSPLKRIPGAGWAMQVGAFIFLDRVWEKDKSYLATMLNYFSDLKHKTQVLIFPEGTDFCRKSKSRSDDFAKKNDWPQYEFCLHPRTTGFTFISELMRKNDHLEAIYDVTVAYPGYFPHSEPELIMGRVPSAVHFHIRRYPVDDVPEDEQGLAAWCQDRWREKETRLQRYYTSAERNLDERNGITKIPAKSESGVRTTLLITLVYWTVFVIGIFAVLWFSSLARWLALAQTVFFVAMSYRHGGFEMFQADYFNWFSRSRSHSPENLENVD